MRLLILSLIVTALAAMGTLADIDDDHEDREIARLKADLAALSAKVNRLMSTQTQPTAADGGGCQTFVQVSVHADHHGHGHHGHHGHHNQTHGHHGHHNQTHGHKGHHHHHDHDDDDWDDHHDNHDDDHDDLDDYHHHRHRYPSTNPVRQGLQHGQSGQPQPRQNDAPGNHQGHHKGHHHGHHGHHHSNDTKNVHIHVHLDVDRDDHHDHDDDHHNDDHDRDEATSDVFATCIVTMNRQRSRRQPHRVRGRIDLHQRRGSDDVKATINLTGFSHRNGHTHGFHIHEYGDMSQNCQSLGEHYNPHGVQHSGSRGHHGGHGHVGDLGNIDCDRHGNVRTEKNLDDVSLVGPHSIMGRSIVIHESADDLGRGHTAASRTSGNVGGRLACCVIAHSKGPSIP